MRSQALADAVKQVRQSQVAVASTISKNMKGYPFGSVTPFMSDSDGKVYLYISDIAQHARNLNEVSIVDFHSEGALIVIFVACFELLSTSQTI